MRELKKMKRAVYIIEKNIVERFARKHKDFDDLADDIVMLIKQDYELEEAYWTARRMKRLGYARV